MYTLSKLFWALTQPSNVMLLLLALAPLALLRGYRRFGVGCW
jgi:hypothetical protein